MYKTQIMVCVKMLKNCIVMIKLSFLLLEWNIYFMINWKSSSKQLIKFLNLLTLPSMTRSLV